MSMNVVQHEPYLSNEYHSYVKYLINNYKVLILTHIYSYLDVAIHVLTPKSAGQWPT